MRYAQRHRVPPKPPWYNKVSRGTCRWCNEPIVLPDGSPDRRRHWHPWCVRQYQWIFFPQVTARIIFERDEGICRACGKLLARRCRLTRSERHPYRHVPSEPFEVDHIIPLVDHPGDPEDPWAAWRFANLQLLCVPCHKAKTAREARERAERKSACTK